MSKKFEGWEVVAQKLSDSANDLVRCGPDWLNDGQRNSLIALAKRITENGVIIADEVGMGKTRIAVEVAQCVLEASGRVAVILPPGLGYQWQDEFLKRGITVPNVLRSIKSYLRAWDFKELEPDNERRLWFDENILLLSHVLTNWHHGANSVSWRWGLLPEVYARWYKEKRGKIPYGFASIKHSSKEYEWVVNAANDIVYTVLNKCGGAETRKTLTKLIDEVQWKTSQDPANYGKDGPLRGWLSYCVGIGLGIFDLIIIDEAHKARGADTGLSSLLRNVVQTSRQARTLALTATPVELGVSQWEDCLERIGVDAVSLQSIRDVIDAYARAVSQIRTTPKSEEARKEYKIAAIHFEKSLSRYVLRRDKREDKSVTLFQRYTGYPINEYRMEKEINIDVAKLPTTWKQAICAAESLSFLRRHTTFSMATHARLTLGSGHGIAALLDQIHREKGDEAQEKHDRKQQRESQAETVTDADPKGQARAEWWLNIIGQAFSAGDSCIYEHPAILAAIETIEQYTCRDEKVLVFGRFVRPLRTLVKLINAREMLRCLQDNRPWPQAKVHVDNDGEGKDDEWLAVRAAHRQLQCAIPLEKVDQLLHSQYNKYRYLRERLREKLLLNIENGLNEISSSQQIRALFDAFKYSAEHSSDRSHQGSALSVVSRAMSELMGTNPANLTPANYANTFIKLIDAASNRDEADVDGDGYVDVDEAERHWSRLIERIRLEYDRPQGRYASLMYGDTESERRRIIQLAFNRHESSPKVLVAQSLVGREGLNLHEACRIVVILHPEWNPGVVEQQIGRVDREASHWAKELNIAIDNSEPSTGLPRIEIHPVIFRSTYDEYNWTTLRNRWDDLRAQLHGVVIPPRLVTDDLRQLAEEIARAAPNFSPPARRRK